MHAATDVFDKQRLTGFQGKVDHLKEVLVGLPGNDKTDIFILTFKPAIGL